MNKITTNTTCHCCEQDTILRIVAGNDFSLRLTLTYKEDDTTKQYDLSDVEDLLVNVVTPDGDRIELDSMIDEQSKITAIVDAQQLKNYIPYGIEVIWHSDTGDKRAAAPNLFTFVNSSREANDAQDVIIEGPYDYNLEIKSDVAYVTLGEVPEIDTSMFVTHSQLDDTLTYYITSEVLSQQSYVTKEYLSEQSYVTEEYLSQQAYITLEDVPAPDLSLYYTKSEIDDTLESYVTEEYLSQQAYITLEDVPAPDLSLYYTKSEIDDTLENYVTEEYLSQQAYITIEDVPAPDLSLYYTKNEIDDTLENYETKKELTTTLDNYATKKYVDDSILAIDFSDYYTKSEVDTTLQDYVTSSSLNTTLADYALETDMTAAQGDITSLDARVTTLENNPQVPDNVVTSDDGNEIICLTQAEYDALEQAQTLDPDAFYYITDATSNYVTNSSLTTSLADYATKNYVDTAVSQVKPDTSNLVTINTTQTISGAKTFTAQNKWTHESRFGHYNIPNNDALMNTDIAQGVNKSGMFVRPQLLQGFVGQVLAPMNNYTNSSSGQFDIQQGVIKFQTVDSVFAQQPSSLTTLAKIDSNGIYEGTTLLSDKYALKSEIPTSSGVSEEDWDNSNEAIAKELTDNRLAHLSINDNFSNYYTKTETDARYATASWANNRFVTKTDDVNRQEAIAAAFAYLQTAIDESGGGGSEVDLSSYVTMDEMNNYSEVVSTALTNNKLDIININYKFNDYYTKSQADSRYVTPNDVAQKYVSNSSLDNLSHVVASSLNDLNDRIPSNTSDLTNDSGFVTSTSVHNIWTGSQSDYDQLTPEADTLYIII